MSAMTSTAGLDVVLFIEGAAVAGDAVWCSNGDGGGGGGSGTGGGAGGRGVTEANGSS